MFRNFIQFQRHIVENRANILFNERITRYVSDIFNSTNNVNCIISPINTGKTTYLTNYSNNHICNGGYVDYFYDIHHFMNSFQHKRVCFLHKRPVIILDTNIDYIKTDDILNVEDTIRKLCNNYNAKIIISSPIYWLHSHYPVNDPLLFKLNAEDMYKLIKRYIMWPKDDLNKLLVYAIRAGCYGFVHDVAGMRCEQLPADISVIENLCNYYEKLWKEHVL